MIGKVCRRRVGRFVSTCVDGRSTSVDLGSTKPAYLGSNLTLLLLHSLASLASLCQFLDFNYSVRPKALNESLLMS